MKNKIFKFCLTCMIGFSTLGFAEDEETINECRLKSFDGKVRNAKGVAKIVDKTTNSKLKVSFFGPFMESIGSLILGKTMSVRSLDTPVANTCGFLVVAQKWKRKSSRVFEPESKRWVMTFQNSI